MLLQCVATLIDRVLLKTSWENFVRQSQWQINYILMSNEHVA